MPTTNPSVTTLKATKEKWSEIEHLPLWDEEFYDVYTAKKYGKWVMLKTLKPEYKEDASKQAMLEKEFDLRYNLAHPSIVMINDYEEVPGVGMAIITDDVFGDSLAKLIKERKITDQHITQLCHEMVDAMEYIQSHHIVHLPLEPSRVIFTQDIGNLKLIDVGYDQHESLSAADSQEDIAAFGRILKEALDAVPEEHAHLKKIAARCLDKENPYPDISSLRMALAGRDTNKWYIAIIIFLAIMLSVFVVLTLIQ